MSDGLAPRVTISLVTWNGLRWLPDCLASVRAQSITDWELRIVDNGSSDGSAAWLRVQDETDERMQLLELSRNEGYCRAHDRSIRVARGAAVLLLNQDVVLDEGFLGAAIAALDADARVGSVQARLLRLASTGERRAVIDSTGLLMRRDRRVVSRDQLRDEAAIVRPAGEVWGADGPAPVYLREALHSARLPRRGGGWEVWTRTSSRKRRTRTWPGVSDAWAGRAAMNRPHEPGTRGAVRTPRAAAWRPRPGPTWPIRPMHVSAHGATSVLPWLSLLGLVGCVAALVVPSVRRRSFLLGTLTVACGVAVLARFGIIGLLEVAAWPGAMSIAKLAPASPFLITFAVLGTFLLGQSVVAVMRGLAAQRRRGQAGLGTLGG